MKRLAIVVVLVIGVTNLAMAQRRAQSAGGMGFFRTPVFVAQPGLIQSWSGGDALDINVRFVTAIPTSVNRLTIVGIIQFTPFQDEDGNGAKENQPAFVYGPVVNVINQRQFSFDIDGLFAYGPTGSVPASSPYTHKFLVEGDFFLKLGSMMNAKSQWNSLNLYVMLAYVLTGLDDPPGPATIKSGNRTVLLTGLSLPLAPWRK